MFSDILIYLKNLTFFFSFQELNLPISGFQIQKHTTAQSAESRSLGTLESTTVDFVEMCFATNIVQEHYGWTYPVFPQETKRLVINVLTKDGKNNEHIFNIL